MTDDVLEVAVEREGVRLAGSLWSHVARPRSLIVMHPGSGPSNRDNDVYFPPIRQALLAAGHAVASFDKRGVGGSSGDWTAAGIETQAADLLACARVLQERVGGIPIGVFGHSQGGWVALEAARDSVVKCVITSSGPGVSPRSQERYSLERSIEDSPESERIAAAFEQTVDAILMDNRDEALRLIGQNPLLAAHLGDLLDDRLWMISQLVFAYEPALEAVRAPLLAAFGSDDQVVPVAESLVELQSHLEPGLLHTTVVQGGDHRLGCTPDGPWPDPSFIVRAVQFVDEILDNSVS